jgi:ribonuclease VapC
VSTFIDASVFAAILGGEDDELAWAAAVRDASQPKTSAIALWEAARAVSRLNEVDSDAAISDLRAFVGRRGIEVVGIGIDEAVEALHVHDRYGKGNHPAKLNMGDCFAYACARLNNAKLLYKGDDFAKTDLA